MDDNKFGTYFEKNAVSISCLINYVENEQNLVKEYRGKSKERIINNYTWEKIASQYDTFFNDIMGADAKRG